MKNLLALLVCILMIASTASADGIEEYVKITVDSPDSVEEYIRISFDSRVEIAKISKLVSISKVEDNILFAYANGKQLQSLANAGYKYEILTHPGLLISPAMTSEKRGITAWDVYPTYEVYDSMMYQFATDYPDLCQIVNAGQSVLGRDILFARISDNVDIEEDEPEVMYTSSMHGNETAGYVMMLRLIDTLLTGYGSDSLITRLIDSCEIWINPLANPDGTYYGGNHTVYGARRYNYYGRDLNRNFPDPKGGQHPDGSTHQAETIVMMDLAAEQSFVLSANMHGGVEVINYPWDTWSRLHPDDDWLIAISRDYADSAQYFSVLGYMDYLNNGITNGYAWYSIEGGRQDYMNFWHGCREITFELSNTYLLPADSMPIFWEWNRVSLFNYLESALYGIRGIVTDSLTGQPLPAVINLPGHDTDSDSSRVFTDPDVGDYHRMLEAGVYDLEVTANGYRTKTITSVVVPVLTSVRVDVMLYPYGYVCGDANGDGICDLGDAGFMINYIFYDGPAPDPIESGDPNDDGSANLGDAGYIINYIFFDGAQPICPE